ncbi:amidohydrolase family protein [Variovorax sp. J22P271]|uniref:amidohydrolase family protein n=1 Tax=Variovorax davisae TaxID=3053515 RepID=UPI0025770ADE|nr:amidohydrolase family protein [Variovorax sp. J22P271]MDM0035311.1 amidohydrolase family protein [Variovorax sp. J22P271]
MADAVTAGVNLLGSVVLDVIEMFGVDRCMFASNYPVDGLRASFQDIFDGFASCVREFSGEEQAKLFVENARRIHRIGVGRRSQAPRNLHAPA